MNLFEKLKQSAQLVTHDIKLPPNIEVSGIFRVIEADYVPPKTKLRARINSKLFTANFNSSDVMELYNDIKIENITLNKDILLQKLP